MSAVGLSFGSPTSGEGFDVSSTVSQIITTLSAVETPWQTQITNLDDKDTALSNIGTLLATVSTDLSYLTDADGVLSAKDGSSSDTNVLELTSADNTAVAGTYTIVVNSLAQTAEGALSEVTDSSDTFSGTLTIQVGDGTAQTVTLNSGDTLSGIASDINDAGIGVTANVISGSSGSYLSIVSNTSGASGNMTVTSAVTDDTTDTSLSYTSLVSGTDADLVVNGLSVTSSSNTVEDVIPGVTFQLLSTSTTSDTAGVQVVIQNDDTTIESTVNQFVSDYNSLVSAINAQEGDDSSGNAEPLYGSPTLTMLQSQLLEAVTSTNSEGDLSNLSMLGISLNDDGTLSLNVDSLDSELNSDFSGVTSFFQSTGGWGLQFSTTLENLGDTSGSTGLIALQLSENSSMESTLTQNISREESLISSESSSLTTELNSANEVLQMIPMQLSEINEIYSAITGYSQTS